MTPRSLLRFLGGFPLIVSLGGTMLWAQYDSSLDRPEPPPNLDRLNPPLEARPQPLVRIYFPPVPLPLEAGSSNPRVRPFLGPRMSRPPISGPLVTAVSGDAGEIFYPQLAGRIDRDILTKGMRRKVESYRTERAALRQELQTELSRVSEQTPAVRLAALEALARLQAPRLARLETQAEALRSDLDEDEAGWGEKRQWQLSKPEDRGFTRRETALAMLNAAFYFPYLTVQQRGLLREVAFDVLQPDPSQQLPMVTGDIIREPDSYRFFSPEMARVRKSEALSTAAVEAWAIYEEQKTVIKKELFDTISAVDVASLGLLGNRALKALAERQKPALAALEDAAEHFRRQLPPRYGSGPADGALPAALVRRVFDWNDARDTLLRDTRGKIGVLVQPFSTRVALIPKFDEHVVKFAAAPIGGQTSFDLTAEEQAILSAGARAIAAEYGKRYAVLADEKDAIHAEIGHAIGSAQSAAITAAFNAAGQPALENLADERENYRAAVYEPGLSAAQRRLLFAAAVEELGLKLPGGELQPRSRDERRGPMGR